MTKVSNELDFEMSSDEAEEDAPVVQLTRRQISLAKLLFSDFDSKNSYVNYDDVEEGETDTRSSSNNSGHSSPQNKAADGGTKPVTG